MIVEKVLGERVKVRILRFFFEFPLVKRNVREVALECRQGFGSTASALKELAEIGILNADRSGKELVYSLNKDSALYPILNRIFLEEKRVLDLPIIYRNLLADVVASTKRLAEACVLFGSLVSGKYRRESDVDLLFVSGREEEIREKCMKLEKRYEVKMQVVVVRKDEIKKFRKSELFKTIKRESVVLFGKDVMKEWLG